MICEITSELVEAYTQCQRKAFLMLQGELEGRVHEYSQIMKERATANKLRFKASHKTGLRDVISNKNEPQCAVKCSDMIADCDALLSSETSNSPLKERVQYVPCIATGTCSVSNEQRLQLAFAGYVAATRTKTTIPSGLIVSFDGQKHRIDLRPLNPKVASVVDDLRKMISTGASVPPTLILNSNCPLCAFRDHCHKEAEENDNLSLLAKMTPKVINKYERKGIFTIKQLSYTFNPRRRRKKSVTVNSVFNVELQALALRTGKIYLHETPIIPTNAVELFLDIEGVPDEGFYYLIGLIVVSQEGIKNYSFWADTHDDEAAIFRNFLAVAASYGSAPIYHYGSYEQKALSQIANRYGVKTDLIEKRLININSLIYGKVYFPSKSNRLKDLGIQVGATWDSPEASGLQSLVWRYQWEKTREDQFKIKLLNYNQEDCQALKLLLEELRNIGEVAMTRNDVEFALKPKQISTEVGNVIHTRLETIIVSAHEEKYLFNRIKIRHTLGSTKDEKPPTKKQEPISARKIPATGGKTIRVPRKRHCSRKKHTVLIATDEVAEHAIIELFFTKSGCKKSIVRYVGKKAYCPTCGARYLPPFIQLVQHQIFGHQFQSWIVNQRIVMRLPLNSIIMEIFDLFNEHLSEASIDSFIQQFAKNHAHTEKNILKKILQSDFIHADETKINIQGINQYAWVLTDGTHVVFWLTETRETTVLQELLKDYKGILVSDFYGGYDAFTCRQQKCLVHLLRDLNEDLWKNPFNLEYEKFVAEVSNLFALIFDDVYKYGLKKRHLGKHVKSVNRFYERTISVHSKCELVEKYSKRFERYRDSLFTFLEGDGIPWNNNMAERAIRHLAIQRKISGYFTKAGAERYLLLLGIAQSCRFQNKSFLRFLLSGEMDVDKFNEKKHLPLNGKLNKANMV